jgi:hypothetical protein
VFHPGPSGGPSGRKATAQPKAKNQPATENGKIFVCYPTVPFCTASTSRQSYGHQFAACMYRHFNPVARPIRVSHRLANILAAAKMVSRDLGKLDRHAPANEVVCVRIGGRNACSQHTGNASVLMRVIHECLFEKLTIACVVFACRSAINKILCGHARDITMAAAGGLSDILSVFVPASPRCPPEKRKRQAGAKRNGTSSVPCLVRPPISV